MALIVNQPCQVIDALAKFQFDVISRLNRKFNALRRIAELLEQIGDVRDLVPNIESLIPVTSITLETYHRLVVNCPFLHLPDASEANLGELRQRVVAAYAALIRQLLNHPHLRMGKLQAVLSRFQQDLNSGAAVVADYLTCLQTICDTAESAVSAFSAISQADIQKEVSTYTKNFVTNGGKVLTHGMEVKEKQIVTTIGQIQDLSTDTVTDASKTSVQAATIL
jgi:hypothetical protein